MAIALTYTFVAGTRALASQVNANFTTLSARALDKTGDTMTGDLKFTDATYDIGKTGATRPRDFFLSRNAVIGGTLGVTGVATLAASTISLRSVTYTLPAADAAGALTSNGSGTLSWASSGNVTKVGTPANDQVGVWTGDGTLEGTANLTQDSAGILTHVTTSSGGGHVFNSTGTNGPVMTFQRSGSTIGTVGTFVSGVGANTDFFCNSNNNTYVLAGSSGTGKIFLNSGSRVIRPVSTNVESFGESGAIYTSLWATNTTIQTSDERYKRDWVPSLGLDFLNALEPTGYRRINHPDWADGGWRHFGFKAQQVNRTLEAFGVEDSWLVRKPDTPNGYYSLAEGELIAPIVKAIQELSTRLDKAGI